MQINIKRQKEITKAKQDKDDQKITSFSQLEKADKTITPEDVKEKKTWEEVGTKHESRLLIVVGTISKVFLAIIIVFLFLVLLVFALLLGYSIGYTEGQTNTRGWYSSVINSWISQIKEAQPVGGDILPIPTTEPVMVRTLIRDDVDWGGPELWEAVNKRRVENGVNALDNKTNLCTIASIRLNELLELEKLDGHEGFSTMTETRPDLEWIFQEYSNVAEFLAAGGETAQETVDLWEDTLGHKQLLTGGEYVWGCVYAQNSFAVAITAY